MPRTPKTSPEPRRVAGAFWLDVDDLAFRGEGPAEVVIARSAGVTVRGVIAADQLGISEQQPARAVFSAASAIVGVDNRTLGMSGTLLHRVSPSPVR